MDDADFDRPRMVLPPPTAAGRLLGRTAPLFEGAARLWPLLVIAVVLAGLFGFLLTHPHHFPLSPADPGQPATGNRALIDAVVQDEVYRATGEIPYLDRDGGGRNRAAEPPALFTHPVYFCLNRVLPAGLSLTLLVLLHVFAGAASVYFLARQSGLGAGASLLAALVFTLAGRLLDSGTRPEELGSLMVAGLFPAILLALMRVIERPSIDRATFLGVLTGGAAFAGDPAAYLIGSVLLAATAPAAWFLCGSPVLSRRTAGMLAFAAVWGLALGAYRWLPVALGGADGLLPAAAAGPWWKDLEGIRLPYHLGAVTLVIFCLGFRNLLRLPGGGPLLAMSGIGLLVAVCGPRSSLVYLGFYLGLVSAAMFASRGGPERPWLRQTLALVLCGLFLAEAFPLRRLRLGGQTLAEITHAPRWVDFLARSSRRGRVAILGDGGASCEDAIAYRQVIRMAGSDRWPDISAIEDRNSLSSSGAGLIVTDLPDARRRFPLLQVDRSEGKYIYGNPSWIGPVSWTRRLERQMSLTAAERADETLTPSRPGAAALPAAAALPPVLDGLSGAAGRGSFGIVADAARTPSGWRCRVELEEPALLVIADPRLPGIAASVDGRPAAVLPANGTQIGLALDRGRHDVEVAFTPPGLEAGAILSALAAAALPFLLVVPILLGNRRRASKRPYFIRRRLSSPIQPPRSRQPIPQAAIPAEVRNAAPQAPRDRAARIAP